MAPMKAFLLGTAFLSSVISPVSAGDGPKTITERFAKNKHHNPPQDAPFKYKEQGLEWYNFARIDHFTKSSHFGTSLVNFTSEKDDNVGAVGGQTDKIGRVYGCDTAFMALQPGSNVQFFELDSFEFFCLKDNSLADCDLGLRTLKTDQHPEHWLSTPGHVERFTVCEDAGSGPCFKQKFNVPQHMRRDLKLAAIGIPIAAQHHARFHNTTDLMRGIMGKTGPTMAFVDNIKYTVYRNDKADKISANVYGRFMDPVLQCRAEMYEGLPSEDPLKPLECPGFSLPHGNVPFGCMYCEDEECSDGENDSDWKRCDNMDGCHWGDSDHEIDVPSKARPRLPLRPRSARASLSTVAQAACPPRAKKGTTIEQGCCFCADTDSSCSDSDDSDAVVCEDPNGCKWGFRMPDSQLWPSHCELGTSRTMNPFPQASTTVSKREPCPSEGYHGLHVPEGCKYCTDADDDCRRHFGFENGWAICHNPAGCKWGEHDPKDDLCATCVVGDSGCIGCDD